MRLQRIYSSKVYLTSSRKDRIHAAINSPINAELVRQLSDYLDDEAKLELKHALSEDKAKQSSTTDDNDGGADDSSDFGDDDGDMSAPGGGGGAPSFTGDIMSDFGDDEMADIEPMDEGDVGGGSEPAEVAESTKVKGKPIKATSTIWTTIEDVVSDCDTIKGTLNAREDTSGVNRLQVKESELWIYFNDNANLNDKMIDVIEVLNSTGYTYLAFSRLARSNNAIVFDINLNVEQQVKPDTDKK